ncbi:Uncharacterised protein [Streptococcus pneumoniae]|nr:Uncharacterised protein [Streptococcus pneumoniae]
MEITIQLFQYFCRVSNIGIVFRFTRNTLHKTSSRCFIRTRISVNTNTYRKDIIPIRSNIPVIVPSCRVTMIGNFSSIRIKRISQNTLSPIKPNISTINWIAYNCITSRLHFRIFFRFNWESCRSTFFINCLICKHLVTLPISAYNCMFSTSCLRNKIT